MFHPWVLEFDVNCPWCSEIMQTVEMGMMYRNHVLSYRLFLIKNDQHRPYDHNNCWGRGNQWDKGLHSLNQAVPNEIKHCTLTGVKEVPNRYQGIPTGIPRIKIKNYYFTHYEKQQYTSNIQSNCTINSGWYESTYNSYCCSLDNTHINHKVIVSSIYHNQIVEITIKQNNYYVFVWGLYLHIIPNNSLDIITLMGYNPMNIYHLNNTVIESLNYKLHIDKHSFSLV